MDRSGSGASEDSPFGSTLNTPKDEVPHPFDQIGHKLLALDAQNTSPKTHSLFPPDLVKTSSLNEKQVADKETEAKMTDNSCESVSSSLSGSSISEALAYLSFNSFQDQGNLPRSLPSSPLISEARPSLSTSSSVAFTEYMTALDIDASVPSNETQTCVSTTVSSTNVTSGYLATTESNESVFSVINQVTQADGIVPSVSSSSEVSSPESVYNRHERASSLYSLPNVPIAVVPTEATPVLNPFADSNATGGDVAPSVNSRDILQDLEDDINALSMQDIKSQISPMLFVKVIGFLPWCVLVGAVILLSPRHLEVVAFSPGYVSSPRGIRRFAYWADCGLAHIMIFLACLVALGIRSPTIGIVLASMVFGQTVLAWQDFKVDGNISLGDDDRQSIYMALKMSMVVEDEMVIHQALSGGGSYSLKCTGAGKEVTSDEDED
ncbi:hypothetical protein VKT23_010819 [Stygiomarasmius scandens]|uniref:Uncharacterized protein n=1 Tax=Marasmiellus scandens TaxID=2682957 RepID=A0ABR1JFY1_9AGAR